MIDYELTLADGRVSRFSIGDVAAGGTAVPPPWARLEVQQCANCPLAAAAHPWCPAAVDVAQIAEEFGDLLSHERVSLRVRQHSREHVMECDVQTALGSLLGVVMAASACPILGQLGGLTRFHLPVADVDETLFRVVGLYLLRQLFVARDGGTPDWELAGLARLYEDLQEVNRAFKRRIEHASRRDANVNAVTILFSLSFLVALSLEGGLEQLRPFVMPDAEAEAR